MSDRGFMTLWLWTDCKRRKRNGSLTQRWIRNLSQWSDVCLSGQFRGAHPNVFHLELAVFLLKLISGYIHYYYCTGPNLKMHNLLKSTNRASAWSCRSCCLNKKLNKKIIRLLKEILHKCPWWWIYQDHIGWMFIETLDPACVNCRRHSWASPCFCNKDVNMRLD